MSTAALILAAGQGKRMHSKCPKVLHPCAELPLVCHVVRLAQAQQLHPIVVVVSPDNVAAVRATLARVQPDIDVQLAIQQVPRGTGDAVRAGIAGVGDAADEVVVLYGDVPLLSAATLARLRQARGQAPLAMLTAVLGEPTGYGRVVRNAQGQPQQVIEERDCSAAQRAIAEINAGVYCAARAFLADAVAALRCDNAQNEYYLTDVVGHGAQQGGVVAVQVADLAEVRGVNSRQELVQVEQMLQRRLIAAHSAAGVTFHDPEHTFVGVDVTFGIDVDIGVGVQLRGHSHLADGVVIEGPSVVRDAHVGSNSHIHAFCHLQGARLGDAVQVGPFARLRPGTRLDDAVRVGNFVEIKQSHLATGAKANHLAYVGDSDVGEGSNLGAGVITCNYDGFAKHRTKIGAGVFVGSNGTLVAPIALGDGSFVAAGSTLTEDVPDNALALSRVSQQNRLEYANKLRGRLAARAGKTAPKT